MPLIIHGVGSVGDVRILFEGDEPVEDGMFETTVEGLKYKAYMVASIKKDFPEVAEMLNIPSPYAK
jgi:hypothetical protein